MKTINDELQQELLAYFQQAVDAAIRLTDQPAPAYFLEQLRPKRVRRKTCEQTNDGEFLAESP